MGGELLAPLEPRVGCMSPAATRGPREMIAQARVGGTKGRAGSARRIRKPLASAGQNAAYRPAPATRPRKNPSGADVLLKDSIGL